MPRDSADSGKKFQAGEPSGRELVTRREILLGAAGMVAGATVGGIASAFGGRGQAEGLYEYDSSPRYSLPLGALNYLDRKQYISNMEVISFLPGSFISGGEPLMVSWAKGKQRMLPADGGFVDISDAKNPAVVNAKVVQGAGPVVYNTKIKKWIMMTTAAQPLTGATPEFPDGKYDKVLRDRVLAYTGLRGIRTYDITDPTKPDLLQEFSTGVKGNGTHANFYDGGQYAYLDCGWDDQLRLENHQRPYGNGLMIVDLSDPSAIKEVSRWWVPGQLLSEEEEYRKYRFAGDHTSWTSNHGAISVPKRVEDGGTIGYGGFGAFGFYVMDLTDIKHPRPCGHTQYEF
ncbi:MAG: hypothetical protein WCC37_26310, partial [Candidatus Sulfotelmatobacter sp.]